VLVLVNVRVQCPERARPYLHRPRERVLGYAGAQSLDRFSRVLLGEGLGSRLEVIDDDHGPVALPVRTQPVNGRLVRHECEHPLGRVVLEHRKHRLFSDGRMDWKLGRRNRAREQGLGESDLVFR